MAKEKTQHLFSKLYKPFIIANALFHLSCASIAHANANKPNESSNSPSNKSLEQKLAIITDQVSYPDSERKVYFIKDVHGDSQHKDESIGLLSQLIEDDGVKMLALEGCEGEIDYKMFDLLPKEKKNIIINKFIDENAYIALELLYKDKLFTAGTDDEELIEKGRKPFETLQKHCEEQGSPYFNPDSSNSDEATKAYEELMSMKSELVEARSRACVANLIKHLKKHSIDTAAVVWGGDHWEEGIKQALQSYNKKAKPKEKISYAAIETPAYARSKKFLKYESKMENKINRNPKKIIKTR